MTAGVADALDDFEALYRRSHDPWSTTTRWYEVRKRALLLATLPVGRYGSAYEGGCGNGTLSEALAPRCERLLASDGAAEAVRLARWRLASFGHVAVVRHRLPRDWPAQRFDLIVLSEVLYFLARDDIDAVARLARGSITPDGTIVVCHWREAIDGYGQTGDDALATFDTALGLRRLASYVDDDVAIACWSPDGASVATREGWR